jgi:hypothetical protein
MFSLTIARICLIHIYRFLDRKTSAAFRAVCRDWREAYDYECTSLALNASLADRVSEFPSFRIFEVPCFGRVRCMNVLFTIRRDVEEIAKADNVYAHIALAKIRHEVRRWVHVLSGFTALTSLSFRLDNDSDKSVLALRPHFPAQICTCPTTFPCTNNNRNVFGSAASIVRHAFTDQLELELDLQLQLLWRVARRWGRVV